VGHLGWVGNSFGTSPVLEQEHSDTWEAAKIGGASPRCGSLVMTEVVSPPSGVDGQRVVHVSGHGERREIAWVSVGERERTSPSAGVNLDTNLEII